MGALATLTQGHISEGPIIRALVASREVPRAVEVGSGDSLTARRGYAPPAWLDLVVTDEEGLVVFSTIPAIDPGKIAGLVEVATIASSLLPSGSFFSDAVELNGRRRGTWYAILPVDAARFLAGERAPLLRFFGLALFAAFAFLFGIVVAAALASEIGRLEKAAIAIAAGDLETPIVSRGAREIIRLASAMNGMRMALREDLGRRARFLAAVSHDLRTPITSIGGYLEAIEDGLAAEPATLTRYVSIMKEKTAVLEERIGGLIEFARLETGEWRLGFENRSLRELVGDFARAAAEECALVDSTLVAELDELGDLEVRADPRLLARAFENLVSNALRHGPSRGVVRIGSRLLGSREGEMTVRIDIDDEGEGVAPAERELIFEAFWRGDPARPDEGSGLGLYIARSIIRGHDWDLFVESSAGGGGRFSISIPILTAGRIAVGTIDGPGEAHG
jgi:signal transduction histidine kinase